MKPPQRTLITPVVSTFPSVTRRASPKRANSRCGCLSPPQADEFHRDRPDREAQGSPKGRVTRASSSGSFSFSQKKMNIVAPSCQVAPLWLRV